MSETTGTSLAEVAADAFGDKFYGPAPRTSNAPSTRAHYRSVEQAHAANKPRESKPNREIAATPARDETATHSSEATTRLSDQDVSDLQFFQASVQRQASATQVFAGRYAQALRAAGVQSFEQLQHYDPSEAAALQADFQQVAQGAQQVQAMHQTIAATLEERELIAAAAKLHRDLPDLAANRDAFVDWGVAQGYSRAEILAETNPNVLKLAYRAFKAETREAARGKSPKYRVSRRPQQPTSTRETEALARLEETGKIRDALELMTIRREQSRNRA